MSTPVRQEAVTAQRSASDDHAWTPTVDSPGLLNDVAKDEAVSTSVSRSTAAEKRTMSDRDATVCSEGGAVDADIVDDPGREERRASRRGSRQTSRQSFQKPPLKKRIVSLSPNSCSRGDILTRSRCQTELFVAERPIKREPTIAASLKAIVFASWLNLLLVFIPVSLDIRMRGVRTLGTGRLRRRGLRT